MHEKTASKSPTLDRPVFVVSLTTLVVLSGILLMEPEASLARMEVMLRFLTHDLGWLFLGFTFAGLIWLGWLSFGRHGSQRLGASDSTPAYSDFSWIGMLFCAGIGSNLLYFGTIEWIWYYLGPPAFLGVEAQTAAAADWAGAYSFFHWGISAWGLYAMATLPIAYVLHVQRSSTLRLSVACRAVLGRFADGPVGQFVDILFIIGLTAGIGTSLGVGVPMISAVASHLFGFERGLSLDVGIVVGLTAVFSYSVSQGLDKGIKLLSDINAWLAIILLGFIWLAGSPGFVLNQAFDSLALMLGDFIAMSLRTDAGSGDTFVQDFTIFYWAWWLAWAPFMGLFVARISGGRTFRQVILGTVFGGSLGCWAGFSILGNTALAKIQSGDGPLLSLLNAAETPTGIDGPQVVVALLSSLPLPEVVFPLFFILAFIFVATSLDSAAFTLASAASRDLHPEGQPPRWHRLTWAFVLAIVALSLMYIGGLKVLQAASVLVGLPLLFVMILMMVSLTRLLRDHTGEPGGDEGGVVPDGVSEERHEDGDRD
jgi:BCCT family betaine/carnitine transporter